mgnify:CR=1 FL=1
MIHARFDDRSHKSAAIAGIYQYDTGQRLKMHGLPSPQELAERDDFLSGDAVTVQAQYGFVGDSQTETRMASYDEASGCWTADIPDIYLTQSSAVKVFVYVGYGAAEGAGRSKTCYEGSFTPVSRPAPGTQVTPEQTNAWDALVAEVNLTLAKMNTAVSGANAATETANVAASGANQAAEAANKAAGTANTAPTCSPNWRMPSARPARRRIRRRKRRTQRRQARTHRRRICKAWSYRRRRGNTAAEARRA